MPELPEVEVTRRSVAAGLLGARVRDVQMGLPLRWPLGRDPQALVGAECGEMTRRGKYLWLPLARPAAIPASAEANRLPGLPRGAADADDVADNESAGGLLIHLGMSGALAFGPPPAERGPYDHFRLHTDRGCLWLTDPRRFGAVVWSPGIDAEPARRLLSVLGPEPFDPALHEAGFHAGLQARRTPVKTVLLSGELVVGAGNIYACEALHLARIDPRTPANKISRPRAARLLSAVRQVLRQAIEAGGSTLKDFSANGAAGHYQEQAQVYGRAGRPCNTCATSVRRIVQGQRATFFCAVCQKR
jgi:formamidopyrimidine-DNA glycosylase